MSFIGPNFAHLMPRDEFAEQITGATSQIKGIVASSDAEVKAIVASSAAEIRPIIEASPSQVATAMNGVGTGSVGALAMLTLKAGEPDMVRGDTKNGSKLWWASANGDRSNSNPQGVWQCLGRTNDTQGDARTTLFRRVS